MTEALLLKNLKEVQQKLKAPKSNSNDFGKYKYRSCEDILEAVKPLLGDLVLTLTDEIVQIGDRYYVKAKATVFLGEKHLTVSAYARETESKKGMDESQITGSASSYARKYALNGLFCIDDTKDADTQDNREEPKQESKKTEEVDMSKPKETPKAGEMNVPCPNNKCSMCDAEIKSEPVRKYSIQQYGKLICYDCQQKVKKNEKASK